MRQQQQHPADDADDAEPNGAAAADGLGEERRDKRCDKRGDDNDPSLRFVLNDDAPYLANLAALWAADPKLAAPIEALDEAAFYPLEPSKSGPPTVAVPTPDGRSIYLHSRYRPVEEAQKLIDPVPVADR